VASCDPEFYWEKPVGYGKYSGSHLALSQRMLSFLLGSKERYRYFQLQCSGLLPPFNRTHYDFLLAFRSNERLSLLQRQRDIGRNFSPTMNCTWRHSWTLSDRIVGTVNTMFSRYLVRQARDCDRQTDGRTDRQNYLLQQCALAYVLRSKKTHRSYTASWSMLNCHAVFVAVDFHFIQQCRGLFLYRVRIIKLIGKLRFLSNRANKPKTACRRIVGLYVMPRYSWLYRS